MANIIGKYAWDIETDLQDNDVFVNGISGKSCHSDSYMTVVEYDKLEEVFKNKKYTKEQWLDSCDYWFDSISIPLKLVAITIRRWISENKL